MLFQSQLTVKRSGSLTRGASLIRSQPTTSDGHDCSLEINETTNLPDNIASWEAVKDTAIIYLCVLHPVCSVGLGQRPHAAVRRDRGEEEKDISSELSEFLYLVAGGDTRGGDGT